MKKSRIRCLIAAVVFLLLILIPVIASPIMFANDGIVTRYGTLTTFDYRRTRIHGDNPELYILNVGFGKMEVYGYYHESVIPFDGVNGFREIKTEKVCPFIWKTTDKSTFYRITVDRKRDYYYVYLAA